MSACRDLNPEEAITFVINGENNASKNVTIAPVERDDIQRLRIVLRAIFDKIDRPIKSVAVEQGIATALNRNPLFAFDFVDGDYTENRNYKDLTTTPPPPVYLPIVVSGNNTQEYKNFKDIYTLADDQAFFKLALSKEEAEGVLKFVQFLRDNKIFDKIEGAKSIECPTQSDYANMKTFAINEQKEIDERVAEATL